MGSDALRIEGFVEVELVRKKDNVRKVYHNTITTNGKRFMLDKSCGTMLKLGADTMGDILAHGNIAMKDTGSNTSNYRYGRNSRHDNILTNALLNLSAAEKASLSGNSTFLPLFDSDLKLDTAKIVGYANSEPEVVVGDAKQGKTDYCKGEYTIDGSCIARRWYYPAGVASGEFSVIAMLPYDSVKTMHGQGVSVSKCIDKCNLQVNGHSLSTGFCPPGVPGYTSNSEILLNTNGLNCKFDLTTGETTYLASGDPFWVLPSNIGNIHDYVVIGNYLYVLTSNGSEGGATARNQMIYEYCYDIQNGMTQVDSNQVKRLGYYEYYLTAKFLNVNGTYYITLLGAPDYSGSDRVCDFTLGSTYYAPGGTWYAWSHITGFTMPDQFLAAGGEYSADGDGFCLGNYGSNYIMYLATTSYTLSGTYNQLLSAIVFTDLSDVAGSIVDVISGLNMNSIAFANASHKGFLRTKFWNGDLNYLNSYQYNQKDISDSLLAISNSANSNGFTMYNEELYSGGTFLTLDKWWTNVISYVVLSEPIQKGDEDEMYVSYGYRVV